MSLSLQVFFFIYHTGRVKREKIYWILYFSQVLFIYTVQGYSFQNCCWLNSSIFFVCVCLCVFKIYSQQNLTVILRMCLGNKNMN